MRRAFALLILTAVAAVAAGCSGADAREAQDLLNQSNAAFAQVRSATFAATISVTGGPQDFRATMSGGGYTKGKRAGDFYVRMGGGAGMGFSDLVIASRSGRVSMRMDGRSVADVPVPDGSGPSPIELVDLTQYVKDVEVDHGQVIDGEPMVKITGLVDTAGLARGILGELTGAGGGGLDLSKMFGDTRVVLYLSEATSLPMRGLLDMPMEVEGEKLAMHLDFAYTSYDKKVSFPG